MNAVEASLADLSRLDLPEIDQSKPV